MSAIYIPPIIVEILSWLIVVYGLIGVIVISIGAGYSLFRFFQCIFMRGFRDFGSTLDRVRIDLGRSIILGIDFLVIADIIETIIRRNYYDVGILAILVIIRTTLTYFLSKELVMLTENKKRK